MRPRHELVASPLFIEELQRALGYPKMRDRVSGTEAEELVELIRTSADFRDDPPGRSARRSSDPGDDDVLALAQAAQPVIVSGDNHLLRLAEEQPVYSPRPFLALLAVQEGWSYSR